MSDMLRDIPKDDVAAAQKRADRLNRRPLSSAQQKALRAIAEGAEYLVCPPCHFGDDGLSWKTFVALNDRGLVWACPVEDSRPQTPPGYFYYGGKGCFVQQVLITDKGREALSLTVPH